MAMLLGFVNGSRFFRDPPTSLELSKPVRCEMRDWHKSHLAALSVPIRLGRFSHTQHKSLSGLMTKKRTRPACEKSLVASSTVFGYLCSNLALVSCFWQGFEERSFIWRDAARGISHPCWLVGEWPWMVRSTGRGRSPREWKGRSIW